MIIGLTGGIGCGKSFVLDIFHNLGFAVSDADKICHEIYRHPPAELKKFLIDNFGSVVFDCQGEVDRRVIARSVFSQRRNLELLEAVISPLIEQECECVIKRCRIAAQNLIMEVPLLFEKNFQTKFDCTLAIWSAPDIVIQRLKSRGYSNEVIKKRLASQFSSDKKLELADFGLINNSTLENLRTQCKQLLAAIK
ncbi:MAG: dephospho-CoA kinase [Victivallaceae bacterium]